MQWEIAYLSDHVIQIAVHEGTFDLVSAPGVQFSLVKVNTGSSIATDDGFPPKGIA